MPQRGIEEAWLEDDDFAETRRARSKKRPAQRPVAPLSAKRGAVEWAVKYAPKTEADLCALIDPKRVAALKAAFVAALDGTGPRLVVVHGPVGCGKSSACRVLLDALRCTVRTWDADAPPPSTRSFSDQAAGRDEHDVHVPYTSAMDDFARFMRESRFPALALVAPRHHAPPPRAGSVALLESLPVVASSAAWASESHNPVHDLLLEACAQTSAPGTFVVVVLTAEGESGLSPVELQRAVGVGALQYACEIKFNALPPGRLTKRLSAVAEREGVDASALPRIVHAGDMRAGLNALQFGAPSAGARDGAVDMAHAVGKLLRGKRGQDDRLSYVPEDVAQACELSAEAMAAFVHENYHVYFGDLRDQAALLHALSEADAVIGRRWQLVSRDGSAADDDGRDVAGRVAESIVARAAAVLNRALTLPSFGSAGMRKPVQFAVAKRAKDNAAAVRRLVAGGDGPGCAHLASERMPFAVLAGRAGVAERAMCRYDGLPPPRSYRTLTTPAAPPADDDDDDDAIE